MSLLFALMALVAMMMAAIALVRALDTGTLALGNLGFKQSTTSAADQAAEAALTWLGQQAPATLTADSTSPPGYYATSLEGLDVTGGESTDTSRSIVDWNVDNGAYAPSGSYASSGCVIKPSNEITVNGATARYLIMRLCLTAGDSTATGNTCVTPLTNGSVGSGNKGEVKAGAGGGRFTLVSGGPYDRIVVRAQGPRNTVSFTETTVHF
jgi:hypothetical protein